MWPFAVGSSKKSIRWAASFIDLLTIPDVPTFLMSGCTLQSRDDINRGRPVRWLCVTIVFGLLCAAVCSADEAKQIRKQEKYLNKLQKQLEAKAKIAKVKG